MLRAIWLIHRPFATLAIPAISIRRVDTSMMNSTMNRRCPRRVHTSTVKKSATAISSQCRLRNSFQVCTYPMRRGIDAMLLQNVGNGASSQVVAEVGDGAEDAPVFPITIL